MAQLQWAQKCTVWKYSADMEQKDWTPSRVELSHRTVTGSWCQNDFTPACARGSISASVLLTAEPTELPDSTAPCCQRWGSFVFCLGGHWWLGRNMKKLNVSHRAVMYIKEMDSFQWLKQLCQHLQKSLDSLNEGHTCRHRCECLPTLALGIVVRVTRLPETQSARPVALLNPGHLSPCPRLLLVFSGRSAWGFLVAIL